MTQQDIIDTLAGKTQPLHPRRPLTRENTQKSYEALFESDDTDSFSTAGRFTIALFAAHLHRHADSIAFYGDKLRTVQPALVALAEEAALSGESSGPYGDYPAGPLSPENQPGLNWQTPLRLQQALGKKLTAALEHTHFLIFHPREASPAHLDKLLEAGWQTKDIVTLSQLVAFLTYQLRVAAGLQALAASPQ